MPNKCSSSFIDWRPNKRRKHSAELDPTVNELDLNSQENCATMNSEESENQSDLDESNLVNKRLVNKLDSTINRAPTGVRKDAFHSVNQKDALIKDSQLTSQVRKQTRKNEQINDKLLIKHKESDGKQQSNLELLRKIFPTISGAELASCLSNSDGEIVRAIQHLVFKHQHGVAKLDEQSLFKSNAFIDDQSNRKSASNVSFGTGVGKKQLNDSLLTESNVLNSIKSNLQHNLQASLTSSTNPTAPPAATKHSPSFNSPSQSPTANIHGQLFKEAFRSSNGFYSSANAKTTDALCSATGLTPAQQQQIQQQQQNSIQNSIANAIPNAIQVNHLLHSPTHQSTSYLSMLASMSNQMENNNCFNNQNLFDPLLHPLNDAMLAMASTQQPFNSKRTNPYNGSNPTNKNLGNHLNNLTAFQRSILNETNGFPYPLYPFLFSNSNTNGDLTANAIQPETNSLKNSLVAAIAQKTRLQQATVAEQQSQFASNENLMSTFNHLLASGQETADLNTNAKEKDTSLTSGSSQCSSPETTTNSCSPIKYSA